MRYVFLKFCNPHKIIWKLKSNFFKACFSNFKDSSRFVVSSVNPLNDSDHKLKYLILLDKDNLNYQKLKSLLDENKMVIVSFFKVSHSDHEIKIASK